MNTRIQTLFSNKTTSILSVYFTAGYPQFDDTISVLQALQSRGVDLVEIGIPFSDPVADGPVIQASNHQALQNGMTIKKLFAQLKNVRKDIYIPLVMMGYLNPIMKFGFEEFGQACSRVGIDGIIIPDLPMDDYLLAYQSIVEKYGLHFIFLITPETSEARILEIDQHTDGFIYMVSSPAVTGVQQSFDQHYAYFSRLQQMPLKNPKLIGFGISNQSTLQTVNQYASGAIVGSAFIKLLTTCPDIEQAVDQLILQLNQD